MDTPPVPTGIWVCGVCNASHVINNAPDRCPECEHERDYEIGCCSNPGDPSPATSFFPGNPHMQYGSHPVSQHASHWTSHVSSPGYHQHDNMNPLTTTPDFGDHWHCNECNADNLDWYADRCPVCGCYRPTPSELDGLQACTSLSAGAGTPWGE
ncbi:hypothetical protein CC86DRAFT_100668 [Ophiobolus disseminans]|uniref:Rubrerythrin rubredoxin-like domain-containing protein n=1 Tax=Ophiobolus disseminans TaxID=1469910 RepID=A0A6A6ZM92_9PLEO|nr:hypothetical protein CC86DRAFT_100668 [Ophiobolus disseminans]